MDKNTLTSAEGEQMLERLRQTRPIVEPAPGGPIIDPPDGTSPEHDAAIAALEALVPTLRG